MLPVRRYVVPVVKLLSVLLFIVTAAGAAGAAMPAPAADAWFLLIVIGVIGIIITAWILMYSLRLMKAFGESTSSLIDALKTLTPMPVVTIADEIPDGIEGRLEVRVAGFASLPFGEVTVLLAPPPGFVLENDQITLPCLDAGETKIFRIGHGPVPKGKYPVGVKVLYRIGEEERIQEFTRMVCAGIPAEPETVD